MDAPRGEWAPWAYLCDPRRCLPGPLRAHIVKHISAAQIRPSRPYPRPMRDNAHVRDLARPKLKV